MNLFSGAADLWQTIAETSVFTVDTDGTRDGLRKITMPMPRMLNARTS
jgi:hypothetical protein